MAKKECIAMILAGGQGSRLNTLTSNLAKPAVPFGGRYRLIDFTLSNCYNSRIDTVGVLTQYQPFVLNSHISGNRPWGSGACGGVFVLPPYMTKDGGEWYKGTANAICQNIDFIEQYQPQYVLVLSGDHVYTMNYHSLLAYHKEMKADITIAVLPVPWEDASRFGIMNTDSGGRIVEFEEKPRQPKNNLASMGIYVFTWKTLKQQLLADDRDHSSNHDFGRDVIPRMLKERRKMFAYPFSGYWKDVGTLESLWQANMDLVSDHPPLDLYDPAWPIYSVDPVQPPHYMTAAARPERALIGEGCLIHGAVERSVLFPGVQVAEGARVVSTVVMPGAVIGVGASVHTAIIGADAVIGDHCRIGCVDGEEITVVGGNTVIPRGSVFTGCGVDSGFIGIADANGWRDLRLIM
ncbi:MAG: glucose-1-phosphate adenylyltransferase [Negativicutes bacterium]|nr:glucose-1-phosphate adenylyltransferase [Negativicutes bacterium]MDR3590733.1 glucose-1-phosphate adenylyltransferase [Negativicutes bacterium]